MRYFLDCEFIEDGHTIDLIGIALISADDRVLYLINNECDFSRASDWVAKNVLAPIGLSTKGLEEPPTEDAKLPYYWESLAAARTRKEIAQAILEFVGTEKPEFWGEWCSYDWVVLCQLFGTMMDLPSGWPMRCNDVIQWAEAHLSLEVSDLPPSLETSGNHNAVNGARTVKARYEFLANYMKENGIICFKSRISI